MRFFLNILFIVVFSIEAAGQLISVQSAFDRDSVMIGEQLKYRITAETDMDVFVLMPDFIDTITTEIEIIGQKPADTLLTDDKRIITKEYTVTSFEPGWNTVPELPLPFENNTISDTAYTAAILLTVLAPAVDTTQAIKAIKPPLNTPLSFAELLPWILLVIGVILLGILGVNLYRKYRRKEDEDGNRILKIREPAHVVAFRDLEELKGAKLPQNGRVKEYYTRLTEIIRVYMERQFDIQAMESTSAEIIEEFASHSRTDAALLHRLEDLLMLADLVKFAKEDPLMKENEMHYANAVSFVENTYRLFEIEESEEEMELESDLELQEADTGKEELEHE